MEFDVIAVGTASLARLLGLNTWQLALYRRSR